MNLKKLFLLTLFCLLAFTFFFMTKSNAAEDTLASVSDVLKTANLPNNVDYIGKAKWNGNYWLINGFYDSAFGKSFLFKTSDLVSYEDLTPKLYDFTDAYRKQQGTSIYHIDFDQTGSEWLISFRAGSFEGLVSYDGTNFHDLTADLNSLYPFSTAQGHSGYINSIDGIKTTPLGTVVMATYQKDNLTGTERSLVYAQYADGSLKDITGLIPQKFQSFDLKESILSVVNNIDLTNLGLSDIQNVISNIASDPIRAHPFVTQSAVPGKNGILISGINPIPNSMGKPWLAYYPYSLGTAPVQINEVFIPEEFLTLIWDVSYNPKSDSWLILVNRGEYKNDCTFKEILQDKTCPRNDKQFEVFEFNPERGLTNLTDKIPELADFKFSKALSNGSYWLITNANNFAYYDGYMFVKLQVSIPDMKRVGGIKWNLSQEYWLLTGSIIPAQGDNIFGRIKQFFINTVQAVVNTGKGVAFKLTIDEKKIAGQAEIINPNVTISPTGTKSSSDGYWLYVSVGVLAILAVIIGLLYKSRKRSELPPSDMPSVKY